MKQAAPPSTNARPRKIQSRTRLRRFVFTLNNYTDDELASIHEYPCKWMICAKETGKENTPHLQGACVIGRQVAFSTLKKYPGFTRAHIESMNGKPSDSYAYCSKQDGAPFTKGTMPTPGKRNDILTVCDKLKSGASLGAIISDPNDDTSLAAIVRYAKGFQYVSSILTKPRTEPPTVIWLHGPTGLGKTRCAMQLGMELSDETGPWLSSGSLRWFDGYYGQSVAIFDDLRTKHAPFHQLLRLLDRYPMSVEIKGAYVNWVPRIIFVTAPKSPSDMWNLRTTEDIAQLVRRVTTTVDVSMYSNFEELVCSVRNELGEKEEEPELPLDLLPRNILDLTDEQSEDLGDLCSTEEEEEEKEGTEDDRFDNLSALFSHCDKLYKK